MDNNDSNNENKENVDNVNSDSIHIRSNESTQDEHENPVDDDNDSDWLTDYEDDPPDALPSDTYENVRIDFSININSSRLDENLHPEIHEPGTDPMTNIINMVMGSSRNNTSVSSIPSRITAHVAPHANTQSNPIDRRQTGNIAGTNQQGLPTSLENSTHFCHECRYAVSITFDATTNVPICVTCGSAFVEELTGTRPEPQQSIPNVAAQGTEPSWTTLLNNVLGGALSGSDPSRVSDMSDILSLLDVPFGGSSVGNGSSTLEVPVGIPAPFIVPIGSMSDLLSASSGGAPSVPVSQGDPVIEQYMSNLRNFFGNRRTDMENNRPTELHGQVSPSQYIQNHPLGIDTNSVSITMRGPPITRTGHSGHHLRNHSHNFLHGMHSNPNSSIGVNRPPRRRRTTTRNTETVLHDLLGMMLNQPSLMEDGFMPNGMYFVEPGESYDDAVTRIMNSLEPDTIPTRNAVMARLSTRVMSANDIEELKKCDAQSCGVCLDTFLDGANVVKLSCNHSYHSDCILPWLRTANTCPTCRAPVT